MAGSSSSTASDLIQLNVGGHKFTTTKATLQSQPDTMLARMCSNWAKGDSERFIDRDGRHFHLVLNFLRDGPKSLPLDHHGLLRELLREAEFYQISSMIHVIHECLDNAAPQSLAEGDTVTWHPEAIPYYWRAFARCVADNADETVVSRYAGLMANCRVVVAGSERIRAHDDRNYKECIACNLGQRDHSPWTAVIDNMDEWQMLQHAMRTMKGKVTIAGALNERCSEVLWSNQVRTHVPVSALRVVARGGGTLPTTPTTEADSLT